MYYCMICGQARQNSACECDEQSDEFWAWKNKHDHVGLTDVPDGCVWVYEEEAV